MKTILNLFKSKIQISLALMLFMCICMNSLNVFSQTQAEMNKLASERYKATQQELNDIYNEILTDYKEDTAFIEYFKQAHENWKTFRNSEIKMKYPPREPGYYGSIHSMCISLYIEKLTRERIETLKQWTEGIEDGDACEGSIKNTY